MYENFIKNNINLLTPSITKKFLQKKGIFINDSEALMITNIAKQNWNDLYNKNYQNAFSLLKGKVSEETYQKLLNLYLTTIKEYL